jgi:signal peptidase II
MYFATAMLASGVICNTYERISFGFVRDFINLKFIEFPVFNISDILINLGVLVIIILVASKKYKRYDKTDI